MVWDIVVSSVFGAKWAHELKSVLEGAQNDVHVIVWWPRLWDFRIDGSRVEVASQHVGPVQNVQLHPLFG